MKRNSGTQAEKRLRSHRRRQSMMTLIDEMHTHINDIEEDEITLIKKREKKLLMSLEHAMEGMKTYKRRARSIVKVAHIYSSKNPCARYFHKWQFNVKAYNIMENTKRSVGRYSSCNIISVILRNKIALMKHRGYLKWKHFTTIRNYNLRIQKMKFGWKN